MSKLDMILVSSGKASLCTGAEVDWNMIDSDHAGVKLWLDVRKIIIFSALKKSCFLRLMLLLKFPIR